MGGGRPDTGCDRRPCFAFSAARDLPLPRSRQAQQLSGRLCLLADADCGVLAIGVGAVDDVSVTHLPLRELLSVRLGLYEHDRSGQSNLPLARVQCGVSGRPFDGGRDSGGDEVYGEQHGLASQQSAHQ